MDPPQRPDVGEPAVGDDQSGGSSKEPDQYVATNEGDKPAENYYDVMPRIDDNRFTKVLTHQDMNPIDRHLYLMIDWFDAVTLTGDLKLCELTAQPAASGRIRKEFRVADDYGYVYDMTLSDCLRPTVWAGFSISGNWEQFVKRHQLRAGDRVFFFKNPNTSVSNDYLFRVKFDRMPSLPTAEWIETPGGLMRKKIKWNRSCS